LKTAILGWGSLLWDKRPEFDQWHAEWQLDGPRLQLEFSRVSTSRDGALTLVLDTKNGSPCQVAYALSKRRDPNDAISDIRCREGTTLKNIGFYFADGSQSQAKDADVLQKIQAWVAQKELDVAIWTDLECNFMEKSKFKKPYSTDAALEHIQALDREAKARAAEYIWRAPEFIETPLRTVLQSQPWF